MGHKRRKRDRFAVSSFPPFVDQSRTTINHTWRNYIRHFEWATRISGTASQPLHSVSSSSGSLALLKMRFVCRWHLVDGWCRWVTGFSVVAVSLSIINHRPCTAFGAGRCPKRDHQFPSADVGTYYVVGCKPSGCNSIQIILLFLLL